MINTLAGAAPFRAPRRLVRRFWRLRETLARLCPRSYLAHGLNNTAGWVRFTPLQFDTSAPFGVAWVTRIYWWQQVNGGDGVSSNVAAFDYVVCVLDRRLGDTTGWMASRGYSSSWNGGAV